jgi:hypothetical protein
MTDKEAIRIVKQWVNATDVYTPKRINNAWAHIEARLGQLQDLEAEHKPISIQEELERR